MTLVSKNAPNFIAQAVIDDKIINDFNLKNYINNSNSVLFFWPMNFTFVCPTEIINLNKNIENFKSRNVKIVGISCDSVYSHLTWKSISVQKGGIGKINFPMISDLKREIIRIYDVEHSEIGVALRSTFIIDKSNIIRVEMTNDLQFGRNINEIIRLIDCINFSYENKNLCPVNWKKGDKGIKF